DVSAADKQMLLETSDVEERLRMVLLQVERQITVIDAQQEIKNKVQRELREKLDALDLPKDARKEVDREFNRMARIARESMEYQVIRTYLETIAELPWNLRSEEH